MVTQLTRLVVPLMLCALLTPPADAQDEGVFEGSPADFLPLQVGNQWTYTHWYTNGFYNRFEIVEGVVRQYAGWGPKQEYDPLGPEWMRIRAIAEKPGYPLTARYERESPLFDLLPYIERELTIEITHTETIESHAYFVFSEPAYDWPPVPNLCLAGQKVRFSDAGVLLIRRQEQDIPVYDFSPPYIEYDFYQTSYIPKTYITPAYPILYDTHDPVALPLAIGRTFLNARLRRARRWFYPPPLSFGPAFVTLFNVGIKHSNLAQFGCVYFLANYGLARYELFEPGLDWDRVFENSLAPVSAVIGGKKIAYPYTYFTSVQPISWGQLKAHHRQRP